MTFSGKFVADVRPVPATTARKGHHPVVVGARGHNMQPLAPIHADTAAGRGMMLVLDDSLRSRYSHYGVDRLVKSP